ncbi:hypothetical protein LRHP344_03125 [Lacticaseibacillus rhamnosus]|nr:hypothetical protein LRHP344_03125 [Lacticaseibacillus rhamnosus]
MRKLFGMLYRVRLHLQLAEFRQLGAALQVSSAIYGLGLRPRHQLLGQHSQPLSQLSGKGSLALLVAFGMVFPRSLVGYGMELWRLQQESGTLLAVP